MDHARRPGHLARMASAILLAALLLQAGPVRAVPIAAPPLGAGNPPATAAAPLPADQMAHRLSAEVYGFLPYWEMDSGTDAYLRYDLVSDIALFSVTVNAAGAIDTGQSGYAMVQGSRAATVIANAHAAGVRVDLVFTSFGADKNAAFFSNPTAMAAGVQALAALVQSLGLDGVNVDVELISGTYFVAYGSFIGQLRAALRATNPDAQVSADTNGSLSGAQMAQHAIANGADRVLMMGYSYRTAGTNPVGSVAPIVRTDGGKSLSWTLDLYAAQGVPSNRLLLGLPYYGWSWATDSGALHATNLGSRGAFFPGEDLATIPPGTTIQTDTIEQSRWFATQDPSTLAWTQTYYDDPETLAAKYALASQRGLAGIGLWALGYDRGLDTYWKALVDAFGTIRAAGTDRYGTAAAVAADAFPPGVDTVYIATGLGFADAVAGSAAAGRTRSPLLLVTTASIPASTAAALTRLHPNRIVILGGVGAVSEDVATGLGAFAPGGIVRAAGADRFGTAAAISQITYPGGAPVAYLATGLDFADALAAGPAAAHEGGPVLLTAPATLSPPAAAELTRLNPSRVVIVGGAGAVSDEAAAAVQALLPGAVIERRGGADRYATAASLAGAFTTRVPVVYIASGLGFADGVCAAAAAGAQDSPLLLATATTLPASSAAAIATLGPSRAVIAGGSGVLTDAVLDAVRHAVASAS